MAEVLVEAANYSIKKKKLEEKRRESIQTIEDFYRPRIETIEKRYEDIMNDIEKRELKSYERNSVNLVNPFLYLTEWLKECERKSNPLKSSILKEAIEEYKNLPSNRLINLSYILEDIKKRAEERVNQRLKYIERNMFSQIEIENFNFKKEMESLNQVLEEAEKVSKERGLKLLIREDGTTLIMQSRLNFSTYLEKLIEQGIDIRNWKLESETHKATIEKNNVSLFIEYNKNLNSLLFHISPTNEIEEYGKTIELLFTTLKNLEEEIKENKKTKEISNKNSEKKKGSKWNKLLNWL